jgi:hypothetical protein
MANVNIIFQGDYIRDTDGVISQVVDLANWDEIGDGDCILANGRVINSRDISMDDVLLESEVVQ